MKVGPVAKPSGQMKPYRCDTPHTYLEVETVVAMLLRMAAGLARRETGGAWAAVQAYIERRAARAFERERRATLLTVPQVLPPGSRVYDRRADGSVLELRIPAPARARNDIGEAIVGVSAPDLQDGHLMRRGDPLRQITAGPRAGWQE